MRAIEYRRRSLWLLWCFVVVAAGLWRSAGAEGEPVVVPKLPPETLEARFYIEKSDWGLPPEGRLIPEDVMVGEPVWLVYEVRNKSDVVVDALIQPKNAPHFWQFEVKDTNGELVGCRIAYVYDFIFGPTRLRPGGAAHTDFLLPKCFDLEKPGTYTIKASVKIRFSQWFDPPHSVRQQETALETSGEFILTIGPANEERLKRILVQLDTQLAGAPNLDRREMRERPGERTASRAFEAIASIKHPSALPYLVRGTWNIRGKVQWFDLYERLGGRAEAKDALLALHRFPRDLVLGQVIPMLDSADAAERMGAVQALGALKAKEAVPSLLRFLKNDDPGVRIEGARALGKIGDVAATPALIEALGDSDRSVRETAAHALGEIGGAAAVPPLVRLLTDGDHHVRDAAARALGEIGDPAAAPELILRLEYDDPTRGAAAEALGTIRYAAAVPALIRLLIDADSSVRIAAATALGKIGDTAAVPHLIRRLQDPEHSVRWVAAEVLGKMADATAVPPLIELLRHSDASARRAAARALGEIGNAAAAPHLEALLNDPDGDVRYDARKALEKISKAAKPH